MDGIWSFPAGYDEDYLPAAGQRYWFTTRETMPPGGARTRDPGAAAASSAPTPTSTRRSTGANGTRRAFIPPAEIAGGFRKSSGRAEEGPARGAGSACRPSAIISACRTARCSTSTAPAARPDGRPLSRSAATTGARSPMRMRASCGAWGCGRATRSASPRSSLSTWEAGARSRARNGSARKLLPVRRRRCRHVGALRAMARHDQADGVLRHADLRAASCAGRARRRPQSARFSAQDHVLFRRARRLDPGVRDKHRGHLRRQGDRFRLDGGDVALDECRGLGADERHAVLAGRRLYRDLRSGDDAARALRPARHAGLHASGAQLAADDPAGVRRSVALDRTSQIRAGALIRDCRRAFSGASTTCSRSAARTSIRARSTPRSTNCRLWRRASHRDQPRGRDGRIDAAGGGECRDVRARRSRCRNSAPKSSTRSRRCSACARWSRSPSRARSRAPISRRAA